MSLITDNPYIHGTSFGALNILHHTEYNLMDPITTIETYGIAPLTGEITREGFDTASSRCNTCFGRVYGSTYNFDQVIKYTRLNSKWSDNDPLLQLTRQLEAGSKCAYSNINIILIFMVRCQQLGHDVSQIITKDIILDIKNTINAFASLLFLETWFTPVKTLDQSDISDAIYTHLTLDTIKSKCSTLPDLFEIYKQNISPETKTLSDNPSSEIVNMISNIFILPKKSIVESGIQCVKKEVELSITGPFKHPASIYNVIGSKFEPKYTLYRLIQNVSSYSIRDVLENYFRGYISKGFWPVFHKRLSCYLDDFIHRINLLSKMLTRTNTIILKEPNCDNYPIIFVCEDDDLCEKICAEYRAKRPLKLGTDITIAATDNHQNKEQLENYMSLHNIKCKVILFDELKLSKNNP